MGKLVKEAVEWWHGRWVVDKTCKREVWSCCTEEHSQKGSVELLYRRAFTKGKCGVAVQKSIHK